MSSYDFSQHEFTPEGTAFIDARLFDQLDCIQNLSNVFSLRPNATNAKRLESACSDHLKSAYIAFQQFDGESADDDSITDLVAYAKGLEKQRITFLNELELTEDHTYTVADHEYETILEHLLTEACECEDYENDVDHVFDLYQSSFQYDMNQLATISSEKYGNSPEAKRKEFMRQLGRHALDITKMSLGVFIGIAAAKKAKII